ncbi:hypothetical protein [Acidaminococcus sp.]|uniref:hypothetical protein n=1 Tax=Acidaminococcus sp. TaxID=1872103 RepID=UPI003522E26B
MKQQRTEQEKLHLLVLTGVFAGLICLFTAYICHTAGTAFCMKKGVAWNVQHPSFSIYFFFSANGSR